jgi:hypothetical protein
MWDLTIHPLKEPGDPVGIIGQPVRSALIPNITARPNLPYIVCFGPYHPHNFLSDNTSPLLSLTPQNAYDKLALALLIRPATNSSPANVGSYRDNPIERKVKKKAQIPILKKINVEG